MYIDLDEMNDAVSFIKLELAKFSPGITAEDKEDLTQDLLCRLFLENRPKQIRRLKPYIAVAARNACCDLLRKRKRRPVTWPLCPDGTAYSDGKHELPVSTYYFDNEPEVYDAAFHEIVDGLTPEVKKTLILAGQGYRYKQIAELTATKLSTVRTRVFNARQKLAPLLTEYA